VEDSRGENQSPYTKIFLKTLQNGSTSFHFAAYTPRNRSVALLGKLIEESRAETLLSADILAYYATRGERMLAPVNLDSKQRRPRIVTEPIGVVFAIEPWDFLYYQLAWVAAPSLMTGNTLVVKHAESVPRCAELFAQLFVDAGARTGVYTNLRLTIEQAARVIADDRVRGVALTGSERAGFSVASEAGRALKKSTTELGGSMEPASELPSGLRLCQAIHRRGLALRSLSGGHQESNRRKKDRRPTDKATTLGPLSSARARELLLDQIDRSVKSGATLVHGGKKLDRAGFYLEPAILTDIDADNPAYKEEFFDPVFLMFRVRNEAEAIRIPNDTSFGLAAVIFGENDGRAEAAAAQIDAGMVFINRPAWTAPDLPFRGVKHSGYGRELSDLGIQRVCEQEVDPRVNP
jgi:succinate-semialdehyde dehydrogenase/glutarate-semialdehyde dehydrogenase